MASKPLRTLEEAKELIQQEYNDWVDYLGLSAIWTIDLLYVDAKALDGDSLAETTWPSYYRKARIRMNKAEIRTILVSELRWMIVHELVHLLFADTWDYIDGEFGKGHISNRLYQQEEKNVDVVTRLLLRERNYNDDTTDNKTTGLETGSEGSTEEGYGLGVDEGYSNTVKLNTPRFGGTTEVSKEPQDTEGRGFFA